VAYPFPSAATEALVECSTERVRRLYPISTPKDDTSFAVFVWSVNYPSDQATYTWYCDQIVLSFVFIGVGVLAFGFLSVLIRCPVCKRNVGWHVLSTANANDWFATLMRLDHCPFCS